MMMLAIAFHIANITAGNVMVRASDTDVLVILIVALGQQRREVRSMANIIMDCGMGNSDCALLPPSRRTLDMKIQRTQLAVQNVAVLYGDVEEKLHELVTLSNSHLHCLDYLMTFLPLQQKASEIQKWMDGEGESCLKQTDSLPDSLENMQISHKKFQDFYTVAKQHCDEAAILLSEAESRSPDHSRRLAKEVAAIEAFRKRANAFRSRLEARQGQMDKALRLYTFLDKVSTLVTQHQVSFTFVL
uniref:Uncharacterized protein n=1 Tax=Eptatretus burgeri TaxID=7764 RepID=A0A8C4WVR7_EPTBU